MSTIDELPELTDHNDATVLHHLDMGAFSLSIHERINLKSFERWLASNNRRCGAKAMKSLYVRGLKNKLQFGDYGGGCWEQPNSKQLEAEMAHVEPRYIND